MIQNSKIRQIIEAGMKAKRRRTASDLTPSSYMRIQEYVEKLESIAAENGRELPKVK
ncbi:MAG: hypothetical protein K9L24_03710 [Spirochaetia bacterium]|nr:hypothetical protein [Spirochaetia bacterium]